MIDKDWIVSVVASQYGVTIKDIMGPRRPQRIAMARQVAMYFCRNITEGSYYELADYFHRDHSTVIWACQRVGIRSAKYPSQAAFLQRIRKRLLTIEMQTSGDPMPILGSN